MGLATSLKAERLYRSIRIKTIGLALALLIIFSSLTFFSRGKLQDTIAAKISDVMLCGEIDHLRASLSDLPIRSESAEGPVPVPSTLQIAGTSDDLIWEIRFPQVSEKIRSDNLNYAMSREQDIEFPARLLHIGQADRTYSDQFLYSEFVFCTSHLATTPEFQKIFGLGDSVLYTVGRLASRNASAAPSNAARTLATSIVLTLPILLVIAFILFTTAIFVLLSSETERLSSFIDSLRAGDKQASSIRVASEFYKAKVSLNQLLKQYDGVVKRTRQFMTKIAHDLNNRAQAITLMVSQSENVDKGKVLEVLNSMKVLINRYQSLSRTSVVTAAELNPLTAKTDVIREFAKIIRVQRMSVNGQSIDFSDETSHPNLVFRGHEGDFDAMVSNLTRNAAKFGKSKVKLSADLTHEEFCITVEDDGDGVDPAMTEHIFKEGARVDEHAPGSGFGLTIVKDVAEIYEGNIFVDQSPSLWGARFRIRFPAKVAELEEYEDDESFE